MDVAAVHHQLPEELCAICAAGQAAGHPYNGQLRILMVRRFAC